MLIWKLLILEILTGWFQDFQRKGCFWLLFAQFAQILHEMKVSNKKGVPTAGTPVQPLFLKKGKKITQKRSILSTIDINSNEFPGIYLLGKQLFASKLNCNSGPFLFITRRPNNVILDENWLELFVWEWKMGYAYRRC